MMQRCRVPAIFVWVVWAAFGQENVSPLAEFSQLIKSAAFVKARHAVEASIAALRKDADPDLAAVVALLETLDTSVASHKNIPPAELQAALDVAEALERVTEPFGTSFERQAARNLAGIVHLRARQPAKALEYMSGIDMGAVPPSERPVFHYNIGRAYQVNGNRERARGYYIEALAGRADADTLDAAFELAASDSHVRAICDAVEKGGGDAGKCYRRAVDGWSGWNRSWELFVEHIRREARGGLDVDGLVGLGEKHPELAQAVAELRGALTAGKSGWGAWTGQGEDVESLSGLLFQIGRGLDPREVQTGGDPVHALNAYLAAFTLQRTNTRAALHAVNLLDDHPEFRSLATLKQLAETGAAGEGQSPEAKTDEVQFRTTLGKLLASRYACGQEPRNPLDPRFQWEYALRLDRSGTTTRNPDLRRLLANCYAMRKLPAEGMERELQAILTEQQANRPNREKAAYHLRAMYYPGGLVKSALQAGLLQLMHSPERWPLGMRGYGKRIASSHGTRVLRQLTALSLDTALRQDPQFVRSSNRGVKRRLLHAMMQTVVAPNDRLQWKPSWWRMGSAFASEGASNMWRPHGSGVGDRNEWSWLARGCFVLGGDTASNVFREFLPRRGFWGKVFSPFM